MVDDEDRDYVDEQDVLEDRHPEERETLQERDFVTKSPGVDSNMLWVWLFFLAGFLALIWGVGSQYSSYLKNNAESRPFLQVSNRDFSLFLWQNPELMRINVKNKSGYLPGFEYVEKVNMVPATADQWVVAPPEALFRYHTWDRLLRGEFSPRPITAHEFVEFLEYDEGWQPENWKDAPAGYKELVKGLNPTSTDDLQKLPEATLPQSVRLAFQGWKNFRYEGEQINAVKPTYKAMAEFLKIHPHYARSYWRNIIDDKKMQYLLGLTKDKVGSEEVIPANQLASFLKVAYFNETMSKQGK